MASVCRRLAVNIARSKQTVAKSILSEEREYGSGEIVEPGVYVDVETGAIVQVQLRDELPEGSRVIHYRRRFRRITLDDRTQVGRSRNKR